MTTITRHFVAVGNRRVHYRRFGEGPPLVMLHGSPGNSQMMLAEIAALGRHFTCFALDTPGFGSSDPLPGDTLEMADLADATAAAIETLGIRGTRLLGTHTGAAIGLELGSRRPDLLGGLVLDGVPVFRREEADALFDGYFAPLVTDPLGGHLTATWMRFRDQFTWFPWLSRSHLRLNAIDRPAPEDIHLWVEMFYRACRHYKPAYRAACFYCDGALQAADRLTLPTTFMATAEDMLFEHLDRLPPLKAGQSIVKLPSDFAAKLAALAEAALALPGLISVPAIDGDRLAGTGHDAFGFIDTPGGRTLVRAYGPADAPALFILHDAPGSGFGSIRLAERLAEDYRVIVPDMPGCGESGVTGDDALLAAAQSIEAIAAALAIDCYAVLGRGVGATVAAALITRNAPITTVLLDGLVLPDADAVSRIAPDLSLEPTGAHWLTAWLMVRDGETYAPWYDGRIAAQRHVAGDLDADSLHDRAFEIMKARTTYARLPRAACASDPLPPLASSAAPVVAIVRADGPHIRAMQIAAARLPNARHLYVADEAELAATIAPLIPRRRISDD